MDVLLEYKAIIHKEVYFAVADLLNLEVDLIFLTPPAPTSKWMKEMQLKTDRIKIDKGTIKEEVHRNGKYLISTSDDTLSPVDVALGYKQLMEVEAIVPYLHKSSRQDMLKESPDEFHSVEVTWFSMISGDGLYTGTQRCCLLFPA